jgi:hypothetical protein
MATGLAAFVSAANTVTVKSVTDKFFRINLVARQNYRTLQYALAGRPMADLVRAGSDVRARLLDKATARAYFYDSASEEHEPQIDENGAWAIAYWCTHMAHTTYREESLAMNSGGWERGSVAEQTLTQEMMSKMQELWTQLFGSLSDSYWCVPDKASMMGTSPTRPICIPAMINAFANGLFQETPGTSATYWTTVNQVAPADVPAWVPYIGTYGAGGAGFTPNNLANLIPALVQAFLKTEFEPPPLHKNYFNPKDEDQLTPSGGAIVTSALGLGNVMALYVNTQHAWENQNDPRNAPMYGGVPFVYEAALDSLPIYLNTAGTGLAAESAADLTGPRYYGINFNQMKTYYQSGKFLDVLKPMQRGLTTWQQGINTMGTNLCMARNRHFILSPSADN